MYFDKKIRRNCHVDTMRRILGKNPSIYTGLLAHYDHFPGEHDDALSPRSVRLLVAAACEIGHPLLPTHRSSRTPSCHTFFVRQAVTNTPDAHHECDHGESVAACRTALHTSIRRNVHCHEASVLGDEGPQLRGTGSMTQGMVELEAARLIMADRELSDGTMPVSLAPLVVPLL